jgi:phage anti-repressor protein
VNLKGNRRPHDVHLQTLVAFLEVKNRYRNRYQNRYRNHYRQKGQPLPVVSKISGAISVAYVKHA